MNDISRGSPVKTAPGPDRARLFETASGQNGYFTTQQASECGFSWALLSHHVKRGHFIRVRRGLYRFQEYPSSPREQVLAAWLTVGKDIATVSHESALDLLELSDVVPDAVHLTVERSRRGLSSVRGVKIHTVVRSLRADECVVRDGIATTSAARSILDAADAGMGPEQVEMAVAQAIERGLTTTRQLQQDAAKHGRRVKTLIDEALSKVSQ
jgi:predicted transcriptional regulator of viral defense system